MPFKTINQKSTPLFPHDCEQCTYIDTVDGQDLYICDNTDGAMCSISFATAIVRFGPDGPEYASHGVPELRSAKRIVLPYMALMLYAWTRYQEHRGVDLDTLNNPKRFFTETYQPKEA